MNILAVNAGSSSLKFQLLPMPNGGGNADDGNADGDEPPAVPDRPLRGVIGRLGQPEANLRLERAGSAPEQRPLAVRTHGEAMEQALELCEPLGIDAIGLRVVHGGPRYDEPTRITPEVVGEIRALRPLAPLHNEPALEGIEAARRRFPERPAVAVFDTAFHNGLPEIAARYALPRALADEHHLRRYGFHGISHRYVSRQLLRLLGADVKDAPADDARLITCHLGNGASVCAVRGARSIDTSMGLTPLEGLVMGTRCGDLDPGLVLHLIRALGMTAEEAGHLLNHESGLLGLSGLSGDVRDLERAAADGHEGAALALEVFAYHVRKYIGAYAAVLGGVDAVAFAGGVGEHAAGVRERIAAGLDFLGLTLDSERNAAASGDEPARLTTDDSRAQAWLIPTDEEGQIACEVHRLLRSTQA